MRTLFSIFATLLLVPGCLIATEWELVWSDEFDYEGYPDPDKWGYDLGAGGWGNQEEQTYTSELENARVENGNLLIQAHKKPSARDFYYTSARLVTREKYSQTYGRVEVRAIVPSETGTWSAIWMLSTDALLDDVFWPNNGEIDIMEHVGYEEDPLFLQTLGVDQLNNIHSTIHTDIRNGSENQGIGDSIYVPDASSEFHVYAMNWYPDRLEFFVDGQNILTLNRDEDVGIPSRNPPEDLSPWWPFTQRFHLIMNIAVGGTWGGHFRSTWYPQSPYGTDGVDDDGEWPQTMTVDYVRFYKAADHEEPVNVVPGDVPAEDFSGEYGIILENSTHDQSEVSIKEVDTDDFVEFDVRAAATGNQKVMLYAAAATDFDLHVVNMSSGESALVTLPSTGGTESWTWSEVAELPLYRGFNKIRLHFAESNDGVRIGALRIKAEEAGLWKGLPIDEFGVIDTGDWMGPVGTADLPWFYVPLIDSWMYPVTYPEEVLATAGQWVFFFSPMSLKPFGDGQAPYYYSTALNRWFYSPQSLEGDPAGWLYVY